MGFTCVQITDDVTFITNEGGQPLPPPPSGNLSIFIAKKMPKNTWKLFMNDISTHHRKVYIIFP